ncbi:hypothetical protein EJ02DRAFT_271137 [Clathrospora elynae]|uniref:Uncharacterized protein n=1 Tax=Clathrospora elynae TaxID=706981 RepID=A0A6A5SE00_9PLEO|nr:hypothetical protein EJ02DRAFT_271137 [Clathrospora elynae]
MSNSALKNLHIRSRNPHTKPNGPPVPPKPHNPTTPGRRPATTSPKPTERSKPLPPIPGVGLSGTCKIQSRRKPLPEPPKSSVLKSTLLWVTAFCLWFLLIVVLLPVITEKDAMPGFNRWLRQLWS